jgi:hypothetical protein
MDANEVFYSLIVGKKWCHANGEKGNAAVLSG